MEQAPVTFDDVAVYFNEEEWEWLHPEQRSLYKEVMSDNYQMILSLNRPDIITNIELGYDPYITSTAPRSVRAEFQHGEFSEASDIAAVQENSHDTRKETTASQEQLKRQRRYPRVNPFRWLKKYRKSKNHSHRIAKRTETQDNLIAGTESRTHKGGADYEVYTNPAEVGGGRAREPFEDSLERMEDSEETTGCSTPPAEHCPMTSQSDQSTQTGYPDAEDKPEFDRTLSAVTCNSSVDAEGVGEETTRLAKDKRDKTKADMPIKAPLYAKTEKPSHRADSNRDNRRCSHAADPPSSPPKATGVMKEVQSPALSSQEKSGRNSVASSQKKEKHVQFSDKVTTFVFEPQAQDRYAETPAEGIKLRNRSPPRSSNVNVAPKAGPSLKPKNLHRSPKDEESKAGKDQGFRPNTVQSGSKKADKSEKGNRDSKLQAIVKFQKKVRKVESKEGTSQERETSSSQKSLSQAAPCTHLEKKNVGTQVDLFSVEEEAKPPTPTPLPPSPAYPTDLTLIKSYSCLNCGKTTHWTRLSDQQKANVEKSIPYMCKMCSRQREKLKAAESLGKATGTEISPIAKFTKLSKAGASPDKVIGIQNPPPAKLSKSSKAVESPDKDEGNQNSTPTKCTKPGKVMLPGSPSRKKPYCKRLGENTDGSPAAKRQKPDKDTNWEELSKRLKISPSPDVQMRERVAIQNKTTSELQNLQAQKKSILCQRCTHSCSSEEPKPQQKAVTETPIKISSINKVSSPDLKPQQKLKPVNGTPTSPSPDPKKSTTETRKAIKDLQNGTGAHGDLSLGGPAASSGGQRAENSQEVCSNCGKHFMTKRKSKPLTSVQHTSPAKGDSTPSSDKTRKSATKPDPVSDGAEKESAKEKKVKKPDSDGYKRPKVAKSQLCTKCGKRLVLHVAPNQDGTGADGNENECVVLLRKKRKRPLAGMEPFKCNECGKIFTRHFSLMQHRFIHTGERPYACKVCGKSFRDHGYLTVHMRSHTKEKPYQCSECGKSFAQHSAIVVHQRTHTHERPFQCKDCGKSFTDRSTFRNHQRIHTGEKPYACSYCGKKFTQQPHMKRHESIHTGDRPFRCRECGKRFIDRCKLKKHELIHTRWEN